MNPYPVTTTSVRAARIVGVLCASALFLPLAIAQSSSLSLGVNRLDFSYQNGQPPAPKTLTISTGATPVAWTIQVNRPWIKVVTPSGSGNATVEVRADTTGMQAGSYSGTLTATAPGALNSPKSIPVTLFVAGPGLSFSTKVLSFADVAKGTQASLPITFANTGVGVINWSTTATVPWISVSPGAGSGDATFAVQVDSSSMPLGKSMGVVTFSAPGVWGSPAYISVTAFVVAGAPGPVQVSVSAPSTTVLSGQTLQFAASVTNATNTQVTWSTSAGSIDTTGKLTAPAVGSATPVTVTARSVQDTSVTGTKQVTVNPAAAVQVSVTSSADTVISGQALQFSANVTNATNTQVTWTTSAGSIDTTGKLTAPTVSSATPVTVTARSVQDTSVTGTKQVTVNPAAAVQVSVTSPSGTVISGQTLQFSASVTNATNTQVTWTTSAGSIDTTGKLTAPPVSSATPVTVTARSVQDTAVTGTKQVTVNPASAAPAVFLETSGLTVIEAEHGDLINRTASWVYRNDRTGFSGTGYVESGPNLAVNLSTNYVNVAPEVRFRVNFTTAGIHYLWVRGFAATAADDSVHVGLDGQAVATGENLSEFPLDPSDWGWSSSKMDGVARITLNIPSTGEHTIHVWMREDGFIFDKLILTTQSGFAPNALGPAESNYTGTLPDGTPAPPAPATLSLSSGTLTFLGALGASSLPTQQINVSTGGTALLWSVTSDKTWLTVSPTGGTGQGSFQVTVNPLSLPAGLSTGQLQVTAPGAAGSPGTVNVNVTLSTLPTGTSLQVGPPSLTFAAKVGSGNPQQSITIASSNSSTLQWTASSNQTWLKLGSASGNTSAQLQVTADLNGLATGNYFGAVTIQSAGVGGSPAVVNVQLTLDPAVVVPGTGNSFYISPTGSASGDGSITKPWNLQTAFNHPAAVKPGDTIWMRGGTYTGTFVSKLTGAAGKPIIVRQYPGERAIIDTAALSTGPGITANGSDTWFWGFEIMSSNPNRRNGSPGSEPNGRVDGIDTFGPRNKFINLIVHDTAQGFGYWTPAIDNEIYGSLIYYNGWEAPDRGHGHGVYTQNLNGIKVIEDNIQFSGFGMGLRVYGSENAWGKHVRFLGNVSFNSGYLSGGPTNHWSNYLVTVGSGAEDIIFDNNHSYHNTDEDGYSQIGWSFSGVEKDALVRNNYFIGGESAVEIWNWNKLTFTGNTMYSKTGFMENTSRRVAASAWIFDNNRYFGGNLLRFNGTNTSWPSWKTVTQMDANSTYQPGRPTGLWTFIRPNKYEPGRANVIVYNWDNLAQVQIDLTTVLQPGQAYEIRDAQNFFGPRVATGIFTGSPVTVPMANLPIGAAVGTNIPFPPKHTPTEFGVFVVLPL